MNSTGTSVNVHSQMCFDIKLSAKRQTRYVNIIKKGQSDITMNLEKLINIELTGKIHMEFIGL